MILLVDDEEGYRKLFASILNKAGYRVIEAADGLEALTLLESASFDLVISDILMPRLNGYALAARIRDKYSKTPIVLTSGYLSQDAAKAILNGATEFIPKPVDSDLLLATVKRFVQ